MYGREQRLKVARDEAKYEEEQAAVRERAEAADREARRQLLLQRARRRYGVRRACKPDACAAVRAAPCVLLRVDDGKVHSAVAAAAAASAAAWLPMLRATARAPPPAQGEQAALPGPEGGAPEALEYPGYEQQQGQQEAWQQQPAADGWEPDAAAMRGLAAGQADHMAALEQQAQQQQQKAPQQRPRGRQRGEAGEAVERRQQPRKRQKRWEAAADAGPPPSLAQLAAQLDAAPPPQQQRQPQEQAALAEQQSAGQQGRSQKLQRFNLFADEEAAALAAARKNPEAEASAGLQGQAGARGPRPFLAAAAAAHCRRLHALLLPQPPAHAPPPKRGRNRRRAAQPPRPVIRAGGAAGGAAAARQPADPDQRRSLR